MRGDVYPKVIVSDRNIALMNAIAIVFPKACNILCQFHIDKNVKTKWKMIVHKFLLTLCTMKNLIP